jgi:hypothetical protein
VSRQWWRASVTVLLAVQCLGCAYSVEFLACPPVGSVAYRPDAFEVTGEVEIQLILTNRSRFPVRVCSAPGDFLRVVEVTKDGTRLAPVDRGHVDGYDSRKHPETRRIRYSTDFSLVGIRYVEGGHLYTYSTTGPGNYTLQFEYVCPVGPVRRLTSNRVTWELH